MPPFLASIIGSLTGSAVKIAIACTVAVALFAGGYVLGTRSASEAAVKAATSDADARVSAVQVADASMFKAYQGQIAQQKARADQLAGDLDLARVQIATGAANSKKEIDHDVAQNSACDLSAATLGVLRGQPARH